ncbi:MAG: histidine kinase [Bacteroidales bacterium]|nr:histidine kinase [Bacteroidales bacterium]MDD4670617.1 histidine kinase [Bacteroidales bacterium]
MEQQRKIEKRSSAIIGFVALIMIFSLPLIMTPRHGTMTVEMYIGICSSILAYVLVFFINYYVLIKRFIFNKQWSWFLIVNLVMIAAVALLLDVWNNYYFTHFVTEMRRRPVSPFFWPFILRDCIFMIFVVSLAVGLKMTLQWYKVEQEKTKIEAMASQAELKGLKNQLNPHFLFNTLNNIYSLMNIDSDKAQNAILGLSKILRYVLYDDSQDKVPLEKELSFTRNYVELMSLRLPENVRLEVNIPECGSGKMIAPLIFISLVENAFKHGISPDTTSFIEINIVEKNDEVNCEVRNSYFPKSKEDKSGSGIGLENLSRRLQLIYPSKHTFVCGKRADVYVSELIINMK